MSEVLPLNLAATEPVVSGYLVGAFFLLLATIAYTYLLFVPSFRRGWRWGDGNDEGTPMSLFGHASWALNFWAWTVVLFGEGLHYAPITKNAGKILFTAVGVVALANLIDNIIHRKK